MEADAFDEESFFRALAQVRCLLIGRRAMVALGLPVLTADYDLWLHIDDIDALNALVAPLELRPTCTAEEARARGRYVLENGERVDVLIARSVPTVEGVSVRFDDLWARRATVAYTADVTLALPSLDDLILTKRFAARRKDALDLEMLQALRDGRAP